MIMGLPKGSISSRNINSDPALCANAANVSEVVYARTLSARAMRILFLIPLLSLTACQTQQPRRVLDGAARAEATEVLVTLLKEWFPPCTNASPSLVQFSMSGPSRKENRRPRTRTATKCSPPELAKGHPPNQPLHRVAAQQRLLAAAWFRRAAIGELNVSPLRAR